MNTDNWEKITKTQYDAYNRVRDGGRFNMVMEATQARMSAGLDEVSYWTIISHYRELMEKFDNK